MTIAQEYFDANFEQQDSCARCLNKVKLFNSRRKF